jgi:hypothetical protein
LADLLPLLTLFLLLLWLLLLPLPLVGRQWRLWGPPVLLPLRLCLPRLACLLMRL